MGYTRNLYSKRQVEKYLFSSSRYIHAFVQENGVGNIG
jgi:hypothetical protein